MDREATANRIAMMREVYDFIDQKTTSFVDTEESLKLHGILSKALKNIPFFAKNPSLLAINRTLAVISHDE